MMQYVTIKPYKPVSLLCLSLLISGCLGYPITEKDQEIEIAGDLLGTKSNPDEKIIKVVYAHGTKYVISPEGPRQFLNGGHSVEYYLEKGATRTALPFLYVHQSEPQWDAIFNIDGHWIAINVNAHPDYIKVRKFSSHGAGQELHISAKPTDAISEVYIDKAGEILAWKQINNGLHQYSLRSQRAIKNGKTSSSTQLADFVKIPNITAKYEEKTFYEDYDSSETGYTSTRRTYPGTSPLDIAKSESESELREASRWSDYLFRWAVAVNPKTPEDVLRRLAEDSSYYVANEARKQLASRHPEDSEQLGQQ